ncbi:MAG: hypothetical protein DRH93_17925 [Deltaproteobacteria bacterium]|nr:MAG: hypothetical protein DRH93_17925 [Deltaproteobacteria bacterium]
MYHNKTMNTKNKKNILIITPPMTSPAMPSFISAFAAGCLCHADINAVLYDANLDFFVSSIFPTDFFKSASFYDPEQYLIAVNRMNDLLAPGLINDNHNQVFTSFCHEKLDRKLEKLSPEVILLALDSENQILAVNIIVCHIKTVLPDIKMIVLKNTSSTGNNTPVADHTFTLENPDSFFQWINSTWKQSCHYKDVEPDFSIFPLKDYLTPELILPLKASFLKDTSSFWDLVSRLKNKYDAKGFLFEDHLLSFDFFLEKREQTDLFFSVQAGMEDLGRAGFLNESQKLSCSEIPLIQWKSPEKKGSLETKMLWDLSRQGIWNHVKLTEKTHNTIKNDLIKFISLNPNIVHSYENENTSGPYGKTDFNDMDASLQPYSIVTPLPGEPFWKCLFDPVHLLLYLKRHGKDNLFCLRADKTKKRLISLGSDIEFFFKKPDDLPSAFFDEICKMVEAGGSVDTKFVRYNLERAYLIGYAMENGMIVGNSSLKHPRETFIQRLNTITGLNFSHFVERGYTSVRPEYRALGVGARLLKGLTKRAGHYKIFSIISEDNTATHKIAIKNKTKKIAVYYSEKAGKKLGVWMPEQMIDKNWEFKI